MGLSEIRWGGGGGGTLLGVPRIRVLLVWRYIKGTPGVPLIRVLLVWRYIYIKGTPHLGKESHGVLNPDAPSRLSARCTEASPTGVFSSFAWVT